MKRRSFIGMGAAAGVPATALGDGSPNPLLKYLCSPDDVPRNLSQPSPPATSYKTELYIPPIMKPVATDYKAISPPADPAAHQLWDKFPPKKIYETHEVQLDDWVYAVDGGYEGGSFSWGYRDGSSPANKAGVPGPTYKAWYGEPVLARRYNDLPPVGQGAVTWALPSTSSHLHNGHTASESDGNPQDWIDSGEFWDHHYCNFPSGLTGVADDDPDREAKLDEIDCEKLSTLWYHDHRLDFTASNVYAGLAGFYFLHDELDTGFEKPTEEDKKFLKGLYGKKYVPEDAWKLPAGDYDIPLILHDIMFFQPKDSKGNADGPVQVRWDAWNTDGIIGDMYTVNRKIRPYLKVDGRKYRFRLVNGGPSRFYELALYKVNKDDPEKPIPIEFKIITGDGNVLPAPIEVDHLYLSVAQRVDFIFDFGDEKRFKEGDELVLVNLLEQLNGKGPSGQVLTPEPGPNGDFSLSKEEGVPAQGVMKFIVGKKVDDTHLETPEKLRPLPKVDLTEVTQERLWTWDYDGGLWTVNGRIMEPNRIDAGIAKNSSEIWIFRNTGNEWSHPIHCHFTEFLMVELNGKPFSPSYLTTTIDEDYRTITIDSATGEKTRVKRYMGGPRRDVATILPYDEIRVFMRFRDFIGKHVMHCHNVVHEDHAMMIRWDMLPEHIEPFGVGTSVDHGEPKEVTEVYGNPTKYDYPDPRPAPVIDHLEERPGQATFQSG